MEYEISNNTITLRISSLGAEMQSLKKDGCEYLWNGDKEFWPERAPVLFPFVGRFTDGKYCFKGQEYSMDIHGFARHMEYGVTKHERDSITFRIEDSEETRKSYPFQFTLYITYTLKDNVVDICYNVENCSDDWMYFGIGGHPGFNVPLEDGPAFEDYYLEFTGACQPDRIQHTDDCFLSGADKVYELEDGKRKNLSHDMFDDDAVVLKDMADEVTLKSDKGKRRVTVTYPKMPYLGLWHAPRTEAPYLCIEPWTSLPSRKGIVEDFQYKHDLVRLEGGGRYENGWKIAVE